MSIKVIYFGTLVTHVSEEVRIPLTMTLKNVSESLDLIVNKVKNTLYHILYILFDLNTQKLLQGI